jgi:hypothetical protein
MKLTCFHCGYQWNRRYNRDPACCPQCGKDWRKPTIFRRIKTALCAGCEAFRNAAIPKGYKPRTQAQKDAAAHRREIINGAPDDTRRDM